MCLVRTPKQHPHSHFLNVIILDGCRRCQQSDNQCAEGERQKRVESKYQNSSDDDNDVGMVNDETQNQAETPRSDRSDDDSQTENCSQLE